MKEALNIKMEYSDFNSAGVIPLKGLNAEKLEVALIELARQETGEEGISAVARIEPMESCILIPLAVGYSELIESLKRGGMAAVAVTLFYDDAEETEQKMIIELTQILEV